MTTPEESGVSQRFARALLLARMERTVAEFQAAQEQIRASAARATHAIAEYQRSADRGSTDGD